MIIIVIPHIFNIHSFNKLDRRRTTNRQLSVPTGSKEDGMFSLVICLINDVNSVGLQCHQIIQLYAETRVSPFLDGFWIGRNNTRWLKNG